jgi:hypothetical protein
MKFIYIEVNKVSQSVSLLTIGCLELPVLREFHTKLRWEKTDYGFENWCDAVAVSFGRNGKRCRGRNSKIA